MTELGDLTLKEEILSTLGLDPRVSAMNVNVQVSNGLVTLSGMVTSDDARRAAEEVTWHVKGVHSVQNQIVVQGQSAPQRRYPSRIRRGQRFRMAGGSEMDLVEEEYLEPPLREENTLICPNCGAEFPIPGEPEVECPECGERLNMGTGTMDEWGKLHPHR